MLCEICHANEARVIYTEIINGVKKEQHLCESCAAKQSPFNLMGKIGPDIQFGNILSGLLQSFAKGLNEMQEKETICGRCGMTASEFAKTGRLGCPNCYSAFAPILDKNLRTLQGAVENKGKKPMNAVYFEPVKYDRKDEEQTTGDVLGTAGTIGDILGDGIAEGAQVGKKSSQDMDPANSSDDENLSAETVDSITPDIMEIEKNGIDADEFKVKIAATRKSMEKAVKDENYELAAKLRDKLHDLEEKASAAGISKTSGDNKTTGKNKAAGDSKTAGKSKATGNSKATGKSKATDKSNVTDKGKTTGKSKTADKNKEADKSGKTGKTGKTGGRSGKKRSDNE